ncbi:MAG: DUF6122 family protein [bacterium]|nr:DUF6122 family protein [bacterium]
MFLHIITQSDWWIHLLASLLLWGVLYIVEGKILGRSFGTWAVLGQLLAANLIDLDHLFSWPIYQAGRCSLNNHFLHSTYLLPVYAMGLLTRFRYFFLGIIVHFLIDYLGCLNFWWL